MKEKFEFKLKIKDERDGKITNFKEKVDLEVDFFGGVKVPQEVILKKDEKEYRIIIKKLNFNGLLERRVCGASYTPSNASYYFYHSPDEETERWNKSEEEYLRPVNPQRRGVSIFLTIFIIATLFVLFLWIWWRKKRKYNGR